MSNEIQLFGTHSQNASVGLPGSDMLGGWYNNAAVPAELFVPIYANVYSKGIIDYRCIAAVNTTNVPYAVSVYFTAPTALTALSAHTFGQAASILVDKTISDTWESVGFVKNDSTSEIMFYQKIANDGSTNKLVIESTHRAQRATNSYNITIGNTLSFQNLVECGMQLSSAIEITNSHLSKPLAVTFSYPVSTAKLSLGTIAAYDWVAIWLKRTIPVIASIQTVSPITTGFNLVLEFA